MTTKITGKVSIFLENKNVDATVVLISGANIENIKSVSWNEYVKTLEEGTELKGQVQYAKAWEGKPAKMLQWFKEDENVRFEIWYQEADKEWSFKNEYTYSMDDLRKFELIHAYNVEIMKSLKKEFADAELGGTGFLTRD